VGVNGNDVGASWKPRLRGGGGVEMSMRDSNVVGVASMTFIVSSPARSFAI
jgi:hypothetical protein